MTEKCELANPACNALFELRKQNNFNTLFKELIETGANIIDKQKNTSQTMVPPRTTEVPQTPGGTKRGKNRGGGPEKKNKNDAQVDASDESDPPNDALRQLALAPSSPSPSGAGSIVNSPDSSFFSIARDITNVTSKDRINPLTRSRLVDYLSELEDPNASNWVAAWSCKDAREQTAQCALAHIEFAKGHDDQMVASSTDQALAVLSGKVENLENQLNTVKLLLRDNTAVLNKLLNSVSSSKISAQMDIATTLAKEIRPTDLTSKVMELKKLSLKQMERIKKNSGAHYQSVLQDMINGVDKKTIQTKYNITL